jgi:UDP-xylose/UDP-N-acetylglucosamine transporter B4
MANMILGILLLNKRYPLSKYLSVGMITVGISIATLASARQMQEKDKDGERETEDEGTWRIMKLLSGIAFLLLALFLSAYMGIYQEKIYAAHGRKHARESMFYNHALPLPGFLLLAPDIWSKMNTYSASTPVSLGPLSLPHMWAYLIANCITQYVCIRGVFTLTTQCTSLFVTLVVTLRKFFSLIVSIFYFHNPFTAQHWLATALVFTGTLLFSGTLQTLGRTVLGLDKGKKKTT